MNPESADLLAQLRDIQAAPPVPWWPPAPGWWVLAGLLLVLLVWLGRRALAARKLRLRRRRLLAALDSEAARFQQQQDPQAFLAALNRLLKLTAIRAFPDRDCAGLQGRDWSQFLAAEAGGPDQGEVFAALASGPYQPHPDFDAAALQRAARDWLARHG